MFQVVLAVLAVLVVLVVDVLVGLVIVLVLVLVQGMVPGLMLTSFLPFIELSFESEKLFFLLTSISLGTLSLSSFVANLLTRSLTEGIEISLPFTWLSNISLDFDCDSMPFDINIGELSDEFSGV